MLDRCRSGAATAAQIFGAEAKAALDYAWSQFGDKRRGDLFLASMVASAKEFHGGLHGRDWPIDQIGPQVVAVCEELARGTAPKVSHRPRATGRRAHDVLVIGGTGLIGRSVVRTLAQQGRSVAVLARDVDAVPRLFGPERIGAFAGSVLEPDGLDGAMRAAARWSIWLRQAAPIPRTCAEPSFRAPATSQSGRLGAGSGIWCT